MNMKFQSSLVTTVVFFLLLSTFFPSSSVIAQEIKYVGMCNASAAVALDTNHFIVADDEDNTLRIYDRNVTARPFQTVSLSKIFPGEIQDGEDLEIDLEGAGAKFGGPIDLDLDGYGIRSIESRNKKEYFVVAGPYHENLETEDKGREQSRLYLWSDKPRRLEKISLNDLNIEAAFFYPNESDLSVQLLSDDGKPSCDNGFRSRKEILEVH